MSQEPEPKVITYFRPGQLIFHVDGNLRDDPSRIEAMIRWANESKFAKTNGISLAPVTHGAIDFSPPVNTEQEELRTYDGLSYKSPPTKFRGPFSLIGVNVKSEKWPLPSNKKQDQEEALNELLELAIHLNENRANGLENPAAVSPNWLMSSSSQPGATGGPGGRPSPYSGSASTDKYNFDSEVLQKIRDENTSDSLGEENVVVAILDTVPKLKSGEDTDKALDRIHNEWAAKGHALIDSLLGSKRKLINVFFDDIVDQPIPGVWPDGHIQVEDHEYEMTDHGLFAAGIIHSLAPQAELYLFQVLNRFGVGDMLSIARALEQIHRDGTTFPKNRLVVNLSLTINIPIEVAHGRKDRMSDKIRDQILRVKANEVANDKETVQTIEWICNSLYAQGAKVIAAAGNNGQSNHRPQACYPAAFEDVLGVGALPIISKKPQPSQKKVKTASYSNRSDRPEWTGITTLGGEEGKEKGVLGIYVGDFPQDAKGNREMNDSGWAWWAGTSFATPIISGMTAAVRGVMPAESRVEEAVVKLLGAQEYQTEDFDEDVLWVKQRT